MTKKAKTKVEEPALKGKRQMIRVPIKDINKGNIKWAGYDRYDYNGDPTRYPDAVVNPDKVLKGSITDILDNIAKVKEDFGITGEMFFGKPDRYSNQICLEEERQETNEEMQKRLKREEAQKARDLVKLEKLKKQYETMSKKLGTKAA